MFWRLSAATLRTLSLLQEALHELLVSALHLLKCLRLAALIGVRLQRAALERAPDLSE